MKSLVSQSSWWNIRGWAVATMARRGVLSHLSKLTCGRVTLQDGDHVHTYGHGPLHTTITVHDRRFYGAVAYAGTVGAGEAYTSGWWSCSDLVALIQMLSRQTATADAFEGGLARLTRPFRRLRHALRGNSRRGAAANIAAHYDLSNDFYKLWLDPTLSYSACEYAAGDDLAAAAVRKLDHVGKRLGLQAHHHLVEIGTGWGGLAIHMAQRFGCRVTTTTISQAQYREACARVTAAGLDEQISVHCVDYRDLQCDPADRVVSIEMIEAIGHRQYPTFFATVQRLLKPDGLALVQAITMPEHRYAQARDDVDFIKAHIFPGCCIPGSGALLMAMGKVSDLNLIGFHDLTADYARTLRAWRERFLSQWDAICALGFDERFRRLWEFYLAYCEGGFAERAIMDVQHVYARPGYRANLIAA